MSEPPGVGHGYSPKGWAGLAALAAAAMIGLAGCGSELEIRFNGTVLTPMQRPALTVEVDGDRGSGVSVQARSSDGRPLTERVAVPDGSGRRTLVLPLTGAGLGLGRCSAGRIEVVAAAGGEPLRRAGAVVRSDRRRCGRLRWAPPALEAPERIVVGPGTSTLALEPRDYEVVLPAGGTVSNLIVEGGRNIVVRGGHIRLAGGQGGKRSRAIFIDGATGTVHLEGLLIEAAADAEGDAVAIRAPQAVVQIENVRAVGLRGSRDGEHADVVQPWGGVRELRVDRLTGSTTYQGAQIPVDLGPMGGAELHDVDLRALPGRSNDGGHMLWLTPSGSCAGYPVVLDDVHITPRRGRALGFSVWPQVNDALPCRAVERDGRVTWPQLPVRGAVELGEPDGGEFVPWGAAGDGYRSPGYSG